MTCGERYDSFRSCSLTYALLSTYFLVAHTLLTTSEYSVKLMLVHDCVVLNFLSCMQGFGNADSVDGKM